MGKFVFKMEPLFEHRKRLEDICKKEHGAASVKLAEEEEKLLSLKALYLKSSSELDGIKERGGEPHELDLFISHIAGLKKYIDEQEKTLRGAAVVLEAKRGELLEAAKKKKAMEIMKERSLDAHTKASERAEQKAADELASNRHKRSNGNEV